MGIIISAIRIIKPAYDFCLQMIPKVNTYSLQRSMEEFVIDCFEALKPLSHSFKEIAYTDSGDILCIGEWIRVRGRYQKYGSNINKPSTFFYYIRKYGGYIKPDVRKPIRDTFSQLVDLAVKLKPYDTVLVKLQIPETEVFEYYYPYAEKGDGKVVEIRSMKINAIGIKTNSPSYLFLFKCGEEDDPIERDITHEVNASIFEDIVSYMVDLFKKAYKEVSEIREHNEKIMKQMEEVVAPFKIASNL